MKRLLILLIGLTFSSVWAGEKIDKRLDADPQGSVTISNTAGSVEVLGWEQAVVQVTGELGSGVKELVFERDGKRIVIKVKTGRFGNRNASADLVVHVPKKSMIEVATVSADIDVKNVLGAQELQAVSGDVSTEVFASDSEIATVSGDIDIRGDLKATETELATVSGDIVANNLSGEFEGASVSGDVKIGNGSFSDASLETTSGNLVFHGSLLKGGKLKAESINGRIDVVFAGDVDAEFDVETFNGRIKNCFGPKAQRSDDYAPGTELKFTQGSGDGRVSLATLNGSIHICNE